MKRGPNIKLVTAIVIAVLVAGIGACFYQYSAMCDANARVDNLRKKGKDEKTLSAQAERTAAQLKECTERLAHLEKGVQEFAYVPTLMKELEAEGTKNGIDVLGVRPGDKNAKKDDKNKTAERKPYEEVTIEIKGRGDFASVQKFLKSLRSFPKIVAARTISLTPKVELNKGPSSKLDVVMELKTYYFPPAKDAGSAPAGKEVASNNG